MCFAPGAAGGVTADGTRWTSADGVTIQARLAGWDGQRVFLVKNGRHFEVPLSRLSPECVVKAKQLLGMMDANAVLANKAAVDREVAPIVVTRVSPAPDPAIGEPRPAPASVIRSPGASTDRHGMQIYPYQVRTRAVRTTAYTCSESDHLIYGNLSALGTPLRYSPQVRSAAADWSIYPVGTTFRIKGLPYLYVVDDYGSALTGTGTIDIYQPDRDSMDRWGCRNVEVTIIRWGSLARGAEILRSRVGSRHCREMLENIARQRARLAQLASH